MSLGFGSLIEDRKIDAMVVKNKPEEKRDIGSIADVFCICALINTRGMGMVDTKIVNLSGTVEEKRRQYKEAFGTEWPGTEPAAEAPLPPARKKREPVSSGV